MFRGTWGRREAIDALRATFLERRRPGAADDDETVAECLAIDKLHDERTFSSPKTVKTS
jgi:hypothetical protein